MVEKLKFDGVEVVLADPRAQLRGTLKVALAHAGIHNIEHTGSIEKVAETVERGIGPDILICDMGIENGKACQMLADIRQNEIGKNPFLGVIGVTWSSDTDDINQAMNCGVDHLISAPLSPQQVIDRIKALARNRLPYVATSGYVGPERRAPDKRPSNTPQIVVPNTLKEKLSGSWNATRLKREIMHAVGDMITLRISHQAAEIAKLAILIKEHSAAQSPARVEAALNRLFKTVDEMDQLLTKRGYQHILDLSNACVASVEKIKDNGIAASAKEFQLLSELGRAIRISLYPDDSATEIAHDIAKTVGAIS